MAKEQGKVSGRINPADLKKAANAFLCKQFETDEKTQCVDAMLDGMFYLNRAWLKAKKLDQDKVEDALAVWLKEQPFTQTVYTRKQILGEIAADDVIGRRVKKSFYPTRSGDVLLVLKPYHILWKYTTGTMHGTPHPYDTHVPLLAMGPGITGGPRKEAVTPQAGVAILSRGLGIKPPAGAEAPVPDKLFAD